MVPVKLDFYRYREEIKQAILRHITRLDTEWDPFRASWLAYALSQEGVEGNLQLVRLIERLSLWAKDDNAWASQRNLGALCFLGYFIQKRDLRSPDFLFRLAEQIKRLENATEHKFSPINDPEQVFPMALFIASCAEGTPHLVEVLKKVASTRMRGTFKRQILYGAALQELGEAISLPVPDEEDIRNPGDIIAFVWYWERYGSHGDRTRWWQAFEHIRDGLSFEQDDVREDVYVLSPTEVALLYEALTRETTNPDPHLLFELYPLHPRIKEIAGSLFRTGEYKNAVEEATKALNAFIQTKVGNSSRTEAELVQATMNPPNPKIKFNRELHTVSGMNEQAGLASIAKGIFQAFRNPKAHAPKDAPLVQIEALEALDQLVIISYIFKRVEQAEVSS